MNYGPLAVPPKVDTSASKSVARTAYGAFVLAFFAGAAFAGSAGGGGTNPSWLASAAPLNIGHMPTTLPSFHLLISITWSVNDLKRDGGTRAIDAHSADSSPRGS